MNPKELEIVVASHNENLWWVPQVEAELGCKVTVYNTGEHGAISYEVDRKTGYPIDFQRLNCISLPNIGREGGQFLYHMVAKRGDYAPYTLFMQADLGWSCCNNFQQMQGADRDNVKNLKSWIKKCPQKDFLPYGHLGKEPFVPLSPHECQRINRLLEKFGKILPPLTMRGTNGAQFMMSKAKLDKLPQEYLEFLYNQSQTDPEFAHANEWAWSGLLDCFSLVWA